MLTIYGSNYRLLSNFVVSLWDCLKNKSGLLKNTEIDRATGGNGKTAQTHAPAGGWRSWPRG